MHVCWLGPKLGGRPADAAPRSSRDLTTTLHHLVINTAERVKSEHYVLLVTVSSSW